LFWEEAMKDYASSCYDNSDLAPSVPMLMSPQLLGGHFLMPKWKMDSIQWILQWCIYNHDTTLFKSSAQAPLLPGGSAAVNLWADSAFSSFGGTVSYRADWWSHYIEDTLSDASIFQPYLSRHSSDTIPVIDSVLDWFWLNGRIPTTTEASFQLWWGITHGLKGYLINFGGDDGLKQHGIVQENLKKTQSVAGIPDAYFNFCTHVGYFADDNPIMFPDITAFSWSAQHHYTNSVRWLPPPNNYAPLFNEVQREMRDDLSPLVKSSLLQQLNWLGSVCWNKKDSTSTYLRRLPVQNISSENLSGTSDAITYVDLGIHKNPADSLALYLSVLNRLLWTDSTGTDQTDTRKISMTIRDSAFNSFYYGWPKWEVTNVGTQWDTVIDSSSSFSITLGAGRGGLYRIAPAVGITTGEETTNHWNNARHIAYDETRADSTHVYFTTYEKKGSIMLASPLEGDEGTSHRTEGTPSDYRIDSCGKAHSPAIAFNPFNGQGLGMVYSIDHAGVSNDSTFIIFRHANTSTPHTFAKRDTLDKFITNTVSYLDAAPAITPIAWLRPAWGPAFSYWVSWHKPTKGGAITLVDTSGNTLLTKYFTGGGEDSLSTSFVSLASRVDSGSKPICHIAFQMDTTGRHIYYCEARLDTVSPHIIIESMQNISNRLPLSCYNRTPCITMNKAGWVDVSWENYPFWNYPGFKQYAVSRFRNDSSHWGDYNAILGFRDSPKGASVGDEILPGLLPVNQLADNIDVISSDLTGVTYSDIWRIGWNNMYDDHMRINRFYIKLVPIYGGNPFLPDPLELLNPIERITESSLEPSLPVRTTGDTSLLQPISYRSPILNSDTTYPARITRYDVPLVPATVEPTLTQELAASKNIKACPLIWMVARAGIITTSPTHSVVPWLPVDTSFARGGLVLGRVTWSNPQVRSAEFSTSIGDTLTYQRVFRIGTYSAGDTAAVQEGLNTISGDYLRASIILRRAFDNSIVVVLDTARLTTSGFVSTTNLSDSGIGTLVIPETDSLYLTMDLVRADSTDTLGITHIESYDDDILDVLPAPDTSGGVGYKAAPNPTVVHNYAAGLHVTVHPNPSSLTTKICVEDLPEGVPATVEIFNAMGQSVSTLYDAIPEAELGLCLSLDCSRMPSGTYYARVVNDIMGTTVKFSVEH